MDSRQMYASYPAHIYYPYLRWNQFDFPSPVFSSIAEAADRPYSHVVVTTKAIPEMQTTPELLKPFLTPPYTDTYPQPTYVLMQNGLNLERDLYNAAKALDKGEEPRILNTAVYIGTRLEGKNVVIHNDFVRPI